MHMALVPAIRNWYHQNIIFEFQIDTYMITVDNLVNLFIII